MLLSVFVFDEKKRPTGHDSSSQTGLQSEQSLCFASGKIAVVVFLRRLLMLKHLLEWSRLRCGKFFCTRKPLMRQTEEKTTPSTGAAPLVPMEKIVSLSKRRGFVYPNSEIYGGGSALYAFWPLGAGIRNNIRRYRWLSIVPNNANLVWSEGSIYDHSPVGEDSRYV